VDIPEHAGGALCCNDVGEACTASTDCCEDICASGLCEDSPGCFLNGGSCTSDVQCCPATVENPNPGTGNYAGVEREVVPQICGADGTCCVDEGYPCVGIDGAMVECCPPYACNVSTSYCE
jgi:hypothetical protein